jgi:hypothetical protein
MELLIQIYGQLKWSWEFFRVAKEMLEDDALVATTADVEE